MDVKTRTEEYPELQNKRSGGRMNSNTVFKDLDASKINLLKTWNILDVGCRTALTLDKLWKNGFKNIYGCDIGLSAEQSWNDLEYKENLIRCDVNQGIPFDIPFHFITFSHTLEHCYDPLTVREFIFEALEYDGYLHCIVPIEPKHDFMNYPYHLVRFEGHDEHIRFWEEVELTKVHDSFNNGNSVVILKKNERN